MTGNESFICPVLKDPESYDPDLVDLSTDDVERDYWLDCLEQMVKKFVGKAKILNPDDPKATEKAQKSYQQFHDMVLELSTDPTLMKPLNVRSLLDFHENNLRSNGFKDAFSLQKEIENELALKQFEARLNQLDSIKDFHEKWVEIAKGVLAGNVFDWGAKAVTDILENSQNFGLAEALETIEKRPWFDDKLDQWINRMKNKPYKRCVIFMDNSGVDLILGIFPLARELLMAGTKVVLTANSYPSLNDVTISELNLYCCKASEHCDVFKQSIENRHLITVENGQKGPCLDLTKLPKGLCDEMKSVDLVILEGMGRAVHTNLKAEFTVDSVKMAVLKNEWLAKKLGAKQFSVICDFRPGS